MPCLGQRAPHADVLRMSNAEGEGLVGVGTTGWHMDGLSYATPFGVALLHIVEVPRRPSTSPSTSTSTSPSPPVDRHSKLDALPPSTAVYPQVPRRGPTLFLPLHPLVETIRRQQPGWERP